MPRLPSLAHCALLAASALPALALAKGSPPAAQSQSRVMVFVGAEDRGAEGGALKLGALVEEAVGRNEKQKLVSLADAAGERLSSEVRAAQRASEDDLTSGKKLLQEGKLDEAEAALHSSIKNAEVAAAAFGKIDDFAEAHAALAAVLHLKHRDDDAKDALIEALVLEPTYRPDAKLGGPLAELFRTVRREATDVHRGSASVFSTPAGGRVFLDGELKGYTPLTIDRIPVGKHLVRMERPGYQSYGQAVEISSTDEVAVKGHFAPTKDFADVEDSVGQALKEVESSAAGPGAFKLLSHFHLDRAIFANVRTSGDTLVLDLSLVDARAHKRVAHRRNSFEGEDPKNLDREVSRLVNTLLADAEEGPASKAATSHKDPLDSVSGMEDWDEDHAGKKRPAADDDDAPKKKKKAASDDE